MSDDLIKRLRLGLANPIVAADRIEELTEELKTETWALVNARRMQKEAEAKLAKAVEALPKLHAVLDILLNNFPTKARPKWVADTERHIDEAVAVLAELEGKE